MNSCATQRIHVLSACNSAYNHTSSCLCFVCAVTFYSLHLSFTSCACVASFVVFVQCFDRLRAPSELNNSTASRKMNQRQSTACTDLCVAVHQPRTHFLYFVRLCCTGYLFLGVLLYALFQSGTLNLKNVLMLTVLCILAFAAFLYYFQESLLFQPRLYAQYITPQSNPAGYRSPAEHGCPYENAWLYTADGLCLHAWFVRPENLSQRKSRPTLLFFHANAGNMGKRYKHIR